MTKVTDKKYYMDDRYIEKLDLMIKRMTGSGTDDNLLIVDGDEGQGKTEFAVGTCYYISHKTGRPYTTDNIFFDLEQLIKFTSETKNQIIHLDEGILGLLSTHWWKKNQQKFLQLVMMARKKRHFIIICVPKFYKINQYVIEERSIGLVHVYSRKNLQKGRFCYFTKDAKAKLYSDWTKRKIKNYKQHYKFHGSFVKAIGKVFTPEQEQEYEDKKDEAIMSLSKEEEQTKTQKNMKKLKYQIHKILKENKIPILKSAKHFGVEPKSFSTWGNVDNKEDLQYP